MNKIIVIVLFFVSTSYAIEVQDGVFFDKTYLTINKNGVVLKHDNLRGIFGFTVENKSVTAIDFDCDGSIDVLVIGGKSLTKDNPEYGQISRIISDWKVEVKYSTLVKAWAEWKKGR